jgi:hypothetical protein
MWRRSCGFLLPTLLVATFGVCLGRSASTSAGTTELPARLAGYRSWRPLTPEAQEVPWQLSLRCALVTEAESRALETSHGPHTYRYVMVYANPEAWTALRDPKAKRFPAGAIIVKEKRRSPRDRVPEGIGAMLKHSGGELPESEGWEFLYSPAGAQKQSYASCITCHRASGVKDYVFGRYGPDAAR